MKRVIVLLVAALAIPTSVAIAKGPPSNKGGKSHPKVLYILKGTLTGYTPYNSSTNTAGSITILVKRANHHGHALKGQTLTFQDEVVATTKVRLHAHSTTIADQDRGVVKVRAAKRIDPSVLASTLQTTPVKAIIDKGSGHGKG